MSAERAINDRNLQAFSWTESDEPGGVWLYAVNAFLRKNFAEKFLRECGYSTENYLIVPVDTCDSGAYLFKKHKSSRKKARS
jgi:hypothetical protein